MLALLLAMGGAWAQTGENIFQYCYDCQRNPAYPTTMASASLSDFANPLVGYKGSGFEAGNTSDGPWKLEYVGLWSTTDKHGIEDFVVSIYQSTYNCTDVPVFRLYQWNATANEYQHAAYGVVCCYAKVSNAVEHTAFFEAEGGWGCVLTNSSHSSSMNITFDEDLTTGLTTLMAAATPAASGSGAIKLTPDATGKVWTLAETPDYDLDLQVVYYQKYALKEIPANWQVKVDGVDKTAAIDGDSLKITETAQVLLTPDHPEYVKSVRLVDVAGPQTLIVAKGSTELSGNKELYYITGDTYRQALARPENQSGNGLGWGFWESSDLTTIYFKEVSNTAWDVAIDSDYNFAPGMGTCAITLDSVIDPNHAFQFVAAQ